MIPGIEGASIDGPWGSDGPDYAQKICDNGYIWWYLDALSEDKTEGLTLIALIGNYCSPYYAAARRKGTAKAENHCAVNAILYRPSSKRSLWSMTERAANSVSRSTNHLSIGPTTLQWKEHQLVIDLDEITVPFPSRLRGQIKVELPSLCKSAFAIDGAGNHLWWPAAPSSTIEVNFKNPNLSWKGHAYLDSNRGIEPLENYFHFWDWYRRPDPSGGTIVSYNTQPLKGTTHSLAIKIAPNGDVKRLETPDPVELTKTPIWKIKRTTRADSTCSVLRTLEDTPFYSRSLVQSTINGKSFTGFHESMALDRFKKRWVQLLLPFRMPRRASKYPS
tara:strand:+ start:675 stop:1673 length:999 start_codon:yes stop_codon:yes gene_type:complete